MLVTSSIRPKSFEIENKDGRAVVVLRKNITEKIDSDMLTGKEETIYKYEEVRVGTKNKKGLSDLVAKNFDSWFNRGKRIEEFQNEIRTKQEELAKLIDEYKQLDLNGDFEMNDTVLFDGLAESYETLLFTDQTAEIALEGIADLYDMVFLMQGEIDTLKGV